MKIFKDNDPDGDTPNKKGYRNVAKNILNDFENFKNAGEEERAKLLQDYAGAANIIFQRPRRDNPADNDVDQEINDSNCRIRLEFDERKKKNQGQGKHTIVLPRINRNEGDDPPSTSYLAKYVKAIDEIYGAGTDDEVQNACDFLFGIMLLTRCR